MGGSECGCVAYCVSIRGPKDPVEATTTSNGQMHTLTSSGYFVWRGHESEYTTSLRKLPTGEPDAGELQVRFGGRGGGEIPPSLPLSRGLLAFRTAAGLSAAPSALAG